MPYHVKEIFLTIQGEGQHTGRVAVFLRFAGCNLWSGREEDRSKGPSCSRWCDTDFRGTDGVRGGVYPDARSLARTCKDLWPGRGDPLCVLTGGEPLLQVDEELAWALRTHGFARHVETNGTIPFPLEWFDWVTLSPKAGAPVKILLAHEVKLVHPQEGVDPADWINFPAQHHSLQPLGGPTLDSATCQDYLRQTIRYCLENPRWSLSLQTHKFIGLP